MSSKSFKIKDIFVDRWDDFVALGHPIRPDVLNNVNRIIHCGDPSMGHALYFCDHCGHIKHVPFTCKSRFCNSCGSKYVQDRANKISSKLIHCDHRHIVFTIPEELRYYFRKDRSLLNLLFEASASTIHSWFYKLNKSESFKPGFISTLHTFGRDLKWNPHIHMLITEGASGNRTIWRKISHFPFTMLRTRWQASLLDLLHQKLGNSAFYKLKTFLFKTYKDGFYVYAKSNMNSKSTDTVQYIIRYTGRPAMAQSRILDYDGTFVTFFYDRHEDDQRVTEKLHVFEFFKRLIIHIPDEQFKMIRHYGLYAKKYKHSSKLFLLETLEKKRFRKNHSHWRARLLFSFGIDPLRCTCGHTMKLLDIFHSGSNPFLDKLTLHLYNSA
ncbi:MAG: transposase [Vallitaleaceae bacterium]|nr:transposase [Vallitaleaceae bacterium]